MHQNRVMDVVWGKLLALSGDPQGPVGDKRIKRNGRGVWAGTENEHENVCI